VEDPSNFAPYVRNPDTLARPWAIPGLQGLEHRIGGLEKQDVTGVVSHDPANHQKMTELRQEKINRIAEDIPLLEIDGPDHGDLLVLGWGSSYGAIKTACERMRKEGYTISFVHLHHLNPFPANLGDILNDFERVFIPEMNLGQLKTMIQAKYLKPVIGYHKVQGQPFKSYEIEDQLKTLLSGAANQ
jgi:2-oxoglutarate ferredoxin oxidoreductase subunit alpha